jgi:hypothetical protein
MTFNLSFLLDILPIVQFYSINKFKNEHMFKNLFLKLFKQNIIKNQKKLFSEKFLPTSLKDYETKVFTKEILKSRVTEEIYNSFINAQQSNHDLTIEQKNSLAKALQVNF